MCKWYNKQSTTAKFINILKITVCIHTCTSFGLNMIFLYTNTVLCLTITLITTSTVSSESTGQTLHLENSNNITASVSHRVECFALFSWNILFSVFTGITLELTVWQELLSSCPCTAQTVDVFWQFLSLFCLVSSKSWLGLGILTVLADRFSFNRMLMHIG